MTREQKRMFPKTRKALKLWDAHDQWMRFSDNWIKTTGTVKAAFEEQERLGRAFGRAYGEETSTVNNPEMCEGCVRPTPTIRKFIGAM